MKTQDNKELFEFMSKTHRIQMTDLEVQDLIDVIIKSSSSVQPVITDEGESTRKIGYYQVKHFNHDRIRIMFWNGISFEGFRTEPVIHDGIESYKPIVLNYDNSQSNQEYIEGLRSLLKMAGCPELLIENPSLFKGDVTDEDIQWAKSVAEKHLTNSQPQPIKGASVSAEKILKPLIKDAHNTNSILNTNKYIKYEDALKAMQEYSSQPVKEDWVSVGELQCENLKYLIYKGEHSHINDYQKMLAIQEFEKLQELLESKQ